MTDVSTVKAHADLQPASVPLYGGPAPFPPYTNGSPALDGTHDGEESSTIKCICGFSDDDGNTVLCEKCDTWQHIFCYYESNDHVPEVHECTDCTPRIVDRKRAAEKQRQHRELPSIGDRKIKPKTTTKSHKRRVKDPLGSVQPNGWAVHSNNEVYYSSERKSGSPRDQPPPNKRPKTSHRTSGSVSIFSQAAALIPGSRKRAGSTVHNGVSPVKSPVDGPVDEYSVEFMHLYRQHSPPLADSNSYTDIRVANDISLWLSDPDALAEATGGRQPADVFERIDQTIENMDAHAPAIVRQSEEDLSTTLYDKHPQWQFLLVETHVPANGYIGELKGRIGLREDYFSDPSNRWDILRHPEPFVFFPPHLPIYIDTRQEGSSLRYARRSCKPNITMKILTEGLESGYHFCFVATEDIQAGEELTISWDLDSDVRQTLGNFLHSRDMRKEGFKKIEPWVSGVLSNFGGCACNTARDGECFLERARRPNNLHAEVGPPPKSAKGKKTKKLQVSPLSTGHATNSRAGSEAFNRNEGGDDENMDSRSTSGSHKCSSRDITPATHFSLDGGDFKMSDRERRKLQQQERLFEQLEYDEQHKGKRGKRNSAGSTLNTPSLSSSVRRSSRPTLAEANSDEQKQLGHWEPSPSAHTHREHSNGAARNSSGNSTQVNGRVVKPKPIYVDSSTQTEEDNGSATPISSLAAKLRVLGRPISFKHKLLQQAIEDRQQRDRNRSASVKTEVRSPALKDATSSDPSPAPPPAPVDEPTSMEIMIDISPVAPPAEDEAISIVAKDVDTAPPANVIMEDVDEPATPQPSSPKGEEMTDAPEPEPSLGIPHAALQPPPPPWPSTDASPPGRLATTQDATPPSKPVDLHVLMPTPDLSISVHRAVTPGSISGSATAQSPIGMPSALSPFSPSVANAVNSGPTRKKLSLSDYTSRRKLAQTQSTGSNSTPPPPSQPGLSPTLSTSSLPAATSPPGKSAEGLALPTVAEEQTAVAPATTTMTTT
jgi:hypothetical protein